MQIIQRCLELKPQHYIINENQSDPVKKSMTINLDDQTEFAPDFDLSYQLFIESGYFGSFKFMIQQIMAIKPTSTDVERTFSISGHILAPRRRKMGEDLIDAIIILNRFYKM